VLMTSTGGSDSKGTKSGPQLAKAPLSFKAYGLKRFNKANEECRHRAADEPARGAQTATGSLQPRRSSQPLVPSRARGYFIGNQTSIMLRCDPAGHKSSC
jgi:hypothetical protein